MESETKGALWTYKETSSLLTVWENDNIKQQLERSSGKGKRNGDVYQKISDALKAKGFTRNKTQCRTKIKKLREEYNECVNHNNKSGKGYFIFILTAHCTEK